MRKKDFEFLKSEGMMTSDQMYGKLKIHNFCGFLNAVAFSAEKGILPEFLGVLKRITCNGERLVKLYYQDPKSFGWARFNPVDKLDRSQKLEIMKKQLLERRDEREVQRFAASFWDLEPLYKSVFHVNPEEWLYEMNGGLIYHECSNSWGSHT
jgi:hypothetical protein